MFKMNCSQCGEMYYIGERCPCWKKSQTQGEEHMKLYGYVWTKDKHEPKFFWTELEARDVQKNFGGEVVPVYK